MPVDPWWLLMLGVAGLAAGFAGGLLGIGAGSLMVPVLVGYYLRRGFDPHTTGLLAIATSLAVIVVNGTRAFLAHRRRGAGAVADVAKMGPFGVIGALAGAELALRAGGTALIAAFAGLELALGANYLLRTRRPAVPAAGAAPSPEASAAPAGDTATATRRLDWWRHAVVGGVAGLTSAFFGVGGGIVAVPLQLWLLRTSMHTAIANSSGVIVFNALFAAGRYAFDPAAPAAAWTLGWVDGGAALPLALGALLGAPSGVRVAHALDATALERAFGVFLMLIGILLLREI